MIPQKAPVSPLEFERPPVQLTRVVDGAELPGATEWAHAVDSGIPGRVVVSCTASNKGLLGTSGSKGVYIGSLDPLNPPTGEYDANNPNGMRWWPIVEGDPDDIWHVYQWGYHWVSVQDDGNNPEMGKLHLFQIRHNPFMNPPFWVVRKIPIINPFWQQDGEPEPMVSKVGIANKFGATNDHFLATWNAPGFGRGLAIGVRPNGTVGQGVQFIHLTPTGGFRRISFVGHAAGNGQASQDPLRINTTGSSAAGDSLYQGLKSAGVVSHIFAPSDYFLAQAPNDAVIRHIPVRAPTMQATGLSSTLTSHTDLIHIPNWHLAMPTAVRLRSGGNDYWVVTYRARPKSMTGGGDDGDIVRTWFTGQFLQLTSKSGRLNAHRLGANRPHTTIWNGTHLITLFVENHHQRLIVEAIPP